MVLASSTLRTIGVIVVFGGATGVLRGVAITMVGPERMQTRPVQAALTIGLATGLVPGVIIGILGRSALVGLLWLGLSIVALGPVVVVAARWRAGRAG